MQSLRNLLSRLAQPAQSKHALLSASVAESSPSPNATLSLQIQDAINGKVISFMRYKYNPSGPDDRELVMYVVGADDSLLDGIATCITLMEARNGK